MAKALTLDEKLAALNRIKGDPTSPESLQALRDALASKTSFVAAKAAEIAAEFEIGALAEELAAVFDRFMVNPGKTDKGCKAKTAAADALYRIGADREDVFLKGIRHVQPEPVWGGQADTAPPLRAACAMGLVRMNHPNALLHLADLLADREPPARAAAAKAIAYSENPAGVPLLRLRALAGDEPEVLGECFTAMLKLGARQGVPFVAGFLDHADDAVAEAAALALGGSRAAEAIDPLKAWWERSLDADRRRTCLLALALLRQEPATAFLLSLIAEGSSAAARDAVEALSTYRHDASLREHVEEAAGKRGEANWPRIVAEAFDR